MVCGLGRWIVKKPKHVFLHLAKPQMVISPPDITTALVTQLNALRDKHLRFRSRVRVASKAAHERDEESRKQNKILTDRIVALEGELNQVKESIEVRFYLILCIA